MIFSSFFTIQSHLSLLCKLFFLALHYPITPTIVMYAVTCSHLSFSIIVIQNLVLATVITLTMLTCLLLTSSSMDGHGVYDYPYSTYCRHIMTIDCPSYFLVMILSHPLSTHHCARPLTLCLNCLILTRLS